jgi:large subunit ribosomal protein L15
LFSNNIAKKYMTTHLGTLISHNTDQKRIGRGGKRGKTSGRGHKGQRAHGGHGIRPEWRDIIRKYPKLRGHGINRSATVVHREDPILFNLAALQLAFPNGGEITRASLCEAKLVGSQKSQRKVIKILGNGELSVKLSVIGLPVSLAAAKKIEAAGGSIAPKQ